MISLFFLIQIFFVAYNYKKNNIKNLFKNFISILSNRIVIVTYNINMDLHNLPYKIFVINL